MKMNSSRLNGKYHTSLYAYPEDIINEYPYKINISLEVQKHLICDIFDIKDVIKFANDLIEMAKEAQNNEVVTHDVRRL